MTKPAMSVLGSDGKKCLNKNFLQRLIGPGSGPSQERFEFGERLLNRGELGGAGDVPLSSAPSVR